MSMQVHIGEEKPHGWYIAQGSGDHARYLHSDGMWRSSTAQSVGRKAVYTGYFPTRDAASKAAVNAGCHVENFSPCTNDSMASALRSLSITKW